LENRLSIMIIDDENIVGKRLQPALEKRGDLVETFVDSREALKRFDVKKFDIVITDIRMDNIDGIEVLEHITEQSKLTKVIMITGYATVEVAREALAKGAFDFIAKPFKPNDLRAIIERAAQELSSE